MDESQLKKALATAARFRKLQVTAGLFRFSVAQFLVALILLLAVYPFLVELEHGDTIETILMTVVLISAVLAVSGRTWGLSIGLVLPALAAAWIDRYGSGLVPPWIVACARMVFVGFVVIQLLRFIVQAKSVNSEVLCAGIAGYVVMGLFWSTAYLLISQLNPGAFLGQRLEGANHSLGRFDALYLSFTSLTCLGSNDIIPISKVARMLMVLESLAGVLYLAVLIARLVAMYSRPTEKE
jgi:hypothetical protein